MLIRRHSFLDARVFEKEARSLARMGHHVTIMAPKHKGQLISLARTPVTDKAFQKGRFINEGVHFVPYQANQIKGKQIERMKKIMVQNIVKRSQTYFVDSLCTMALRERADVYYAHEWETLYEAVQIKRMLKKQNSHVKVIFDAHELEEHNTLLKVLMREVDHIITVSDSLKSIYSSRYPKIPITVIYNSPHFHEQERPIEKYESLASADKPFTIAYEGRLSINKGDPYKILEIVNLLNRSSMKVKFMILGTVALTNKLEMNKIIKKLRSHPQIHYGWVDYKDLHQFWTMVDVGYIYFNLNDLNRVYALPNKFFSFLNSGIPVVVNAAPEMESFINKYQCGIIIKKKNPTAADYAAYFASLSKNRELLSRLSINAREIMRTTFCWERMEERLAGVMKLMK
jgi:glycosyltransferase involved in cell wall biosynthesis